jgi:hypothetical protein
MIRGERFLFEDVRGCKAAPAGRVRKHVAKRVDGRGRKADQGKDAPGYLGASVRREATGKRAGKIKGGDGDARRKLKRLRRRRLAFL